MTWGDGLASLVGYGWGRHQYTFLGHTRSWEGSAAMAIGGFIAMFLTLWLLPGSALSPNSEPFGMASSLVLALAGTVIATVAEGFSPAGTDNLSVPLLTGALLYLASVLL
ncbi:MAG: Cytidylyltransferase family protein [Chloroflexi bacterium ADurb.Bin360]|nr:MAG: Cytidylyltransferase family protein [Chloroflexi bacterium ADurb.Bin360]